MDPLWDWFFRIKAWIGAIPIFHTGVGSASLALYGSADLWWTAQLWLSRDCHPDQGRMIDQPQGWEPHRQFGIQWDCLSNSLGCCFCLLLAQSAICLVISFLFSNRKMWQGALVYCFNSFCSCFAIISTSSPAQIDKKWTSEQHYQLQPLMALSSLAHLFTNLTSLVRREMTSINTLRG